jgi:hypothetical protein
MLMTAARFLLLLGVMSIPVVASAADCSTKFPPGFYGIPVTDSLFRAGAFHVSGWQAIAVQKNSVEWDDCELVIPNDIYRLVYDRTEPLTAGCYGDFDGDSKRDYAFLLKSDSTGVVLPYVFLQVTTGFQAFALQPVFDRDGFNEDPHFPPGPFRVRKPMFYYVSVGNAPPDSTLPRSDYIQVGWETYFWDGVRFVALWTSD